MANLLLHGFELSQAAPPKEPVSAVDLVTPVLDPGQPSEENEARAWTVTFRSILEIRHPAVLSGAVRGEPVNLYVVIDGNGDVVASAVDTEQTSGSCSATLVEKLGIQRDVETYDMGGCGSLEEGEAGPSRVIVFRQSLKPAGTGGGAQPRGGRCPANHDPG